MSTSVIKIFLKKLFGKQEARPVELSLSTNKEITTRLKRASELRLSGQYELALIECNNVLTLYPGSPMAYHVRALIKYDLDDQDGAIRDWNRFKSLRKQVKSTGMLAEEV